MDIAIDRKYLSNHLTFKYLDFHFQLIVTESVTANNTLEVLPFKKFITETKIQTRLFT